MNTLTITDYPFTDIAGSSLLNTNYSITTYSPSSAGSITMSITTNYTSDTSYWLDDITITNVMSNSQYNISVYFFCSLSGSSSQTVSFSTSLGNPIPSWISVDLSKSQLVINAPNITTDTNYVFTLASISSENAKTYYRNVYVQGIPCLAQNWLICQSQSKAQWNKWVPGFSVNQSTGQWEISNNSSQSSSSNSSSSNSSSSTSNSSKSRSDADSDYSQTTVTTSSVANQAVMGVGVTSMAAASAFSLSSPQGMWSWFNEFQLLMLLLLTGAYFPKEIVKFLEGMDFTSFSFNFIPTINALKLVSLTSWIDSNLDNEYLQVIGMNSGSAFVNNFSLICTVIFIILIHWFYWVVHRMLLKKFTERPILLKIINSIMRILTFNIYIRITIEAYQFLVISSAYEINRFNVENSSRKVSISIAFLIYFTCIAFIVFIAIETYCWVKSVEMKCHALFKELFEETKSTKLAKCYSLIAMLRKLIFVSFLIFAESLSTIITVGILVFLELLYIINFIIIRPFKSVKNNIIEVMNEFIFFGLACTLFHFNKQSEWTNTMILIFILIVTASNLISAFIHISKLFFILLILTLIFIVLLIVTLIKMVIKCLSKNKTHSKSHANVRWCVLLLFILYLEISRKCWNKNSKLSKQN